MTTTAVVPAGAEVAPIKPGGPNKFHSFLKKAEADFAKILQEGAKLEPGIAAGASIVAVACGHPEIAFAIQKIGSVVAGAGGLVTTVQGTAGTAEQKIAVAAPLVDQLIKNSGFLGGRAITNETKWAAAMAQLADVVGAMYDSVEAVPTAANATATDPAGTKLAQVAQVMAAGKTS